MGKRSNFKKVNKDLYRTIDPKAARILLPYLGGVRSFVEPFAGSGDLVGPFLRAGLDCKARYDIQPRYRMVEKRDVLSLEIEDLKGAEAIITNPPWSRDRASGYLLHRIIDHLRVMVPTWLLFDADWAYTGQSEPYMRYCSLIVPVGRLRWIPGTTTKGKDNCSWYFFQKDEAEIRQFEKVAA
ncbi:hypothetical protein PsAD5_02155 [Pseudovibrio sp. Ad5]|uniref:hypothetical protein n=1 Tax=Pseudovibrio sp. Ad5 TaxID=989436 RepID=UPI0007AE4919|nr:hypothetical protein [Pseudovibrio sp. Ad5]KZK97916.1 hypothetical protein PsAD5_02155 [Pseudovibrio sp. Ad5]